MQIRSMVALSLAAALVAACNLNVQAPRPQTDQNAIETIVEQTLQAAAITPFASPAGPSDSTPISQTAAGTPATAASATITITPTPTGPKPMLSITGNSNCRTGPGGSFDNVTGFIPGTQLEIVGRNADKTYWQVKIPGGEQTCWVWGQYATATGNVDAVPESTAAAELVTAPAAPGALYYQYNCSVSDITVSLRWTDNADNEKGYRIYRFDTLIADLPANAANYEDTYMVAPPQHLRYSVAAYNDSGESAPRRQEFTACP